MKKKRMDENSDKLSIFSRASNFFQKIMSPSKEPVIKTVTEVADSSKYWIKEAENYNTYQDWNSFVHATEVPVEYIQAEDKNFMCDRDTIWDLHRMQDPEKNDICYDNKVDYYTTRFLKMRFSKGPNYYKTGKFDGAIVSDHFTDDILLDIRRMEWKNSNCSCRHNYVNDDWAIPNKDSITFCHPNSGDLMLRMFESDELAWEEMLRQVNRQYSSAQLQAELEAELQIIEAEKQKQKMKKRRGGTARKEQNRWVRSSRAINAQLKQHQEDIRACCNFGIRFKEEEDISIVDSDSFGSDSYSSTYYEEEEDDDDEDYYDECEWFCGDYEQQHPFLRDCLDIHDYRELNKRTEMNNGGSGTSCGTGVGGIKRDSSLGASKIAFDSPHGLLHISNMFTVQHSGREPSITSDIRTPSTTTASGHSTMSKEKKNNNTPHSMLHVEKAQPPVPRESEHPQSSLQRSPSRELVFQHNQVGVPSSCPPIPATPAGAYLSGSPAVAGVG